MPKKEIQISNIVGNAQSGTQLSNPDIWTKKR